MARSKQEFPIGVRAAAKLARTIGPLFPRIFTPQLKNPVFMVGCGRSGTSLLASVLSSHPAIAVLPNEANDLWHPDLYPWHLSRTGLPPMWVDPQRFTNHSLERLDWSEIHAMFGAFQLLTRRPVFLNKSVMLSFMLRDIARHFKDARFIHMYRDGRAVALSYAKMNLPKILKNPAVYASAGISDDRDELMYLSFDHWRAHLEAVEQADREEGLTASGRLLEFSYEELSANPDQHLARVLAFMGLPGDSRELTSQTRIENRNHKVFDELGVVHLQRFIDRGGSTLERKGYAVVST